MFPTLKLLTYFSTAVLSATVPQPAQGAYEGGSGASLSLTPINDSSAEPVLSDSSLVIESVGDVLSANTTFLLPDSNSSNPEYALPFEYPDLDLLGATNADLHCKGGNLGVNLSRVSCNSAFDRLSNSPSVLTWGQRGAGNFQVKLPFRASSSDGFCAIDVVHAPGKVSDLTSPLQVKQAATQVINGCVKNGAPNTGGLIRNIGQNGDLIVAVRLYIPNNHCSYFGGMSVIGCKSVLSVMPVATESLVFGMAADPTTRVVLPRIFTAGEQNADFVKSYGFLNNGTPLTMNLNHHNITNQFLAGTRCQAKIDLGPDRTPVTARWFDIWEAGNAIEAMCCAQNKGGTAYSIGARAGLRLEIKN